MDWVQPDPGRCGISTMVEVGRLAHRLTGRGLRDRGLHGDQVLRSDRSEGREALAERLPLRGADEAFRQLVADGDGNAGKRLGAACHDHLGLTDLDELGRVGDRLVRRRARP